MAEDSTIEWTDHTFNPWIGCTKVSPACDHCYAEAWDKRFKGDRWGAKSDRTRTSATNWRNPIKLNRKASEKGVRERIFCASLADVFDNHKSILPAWRDDLWKLIKATPHLDWLLLTKRPQNIIKFLPDDWGDGYENVWLGTTVENQTEADRRIPHLIHAPARMRFLSCEPLLGPVDLQRVNPRAAPNPLVHWDVLNGTRSWGGPACLPRLSWVIVGGENHKQPREMKIDWVRSLRDQCASAGVPFLFKQWSGSGQKAIKAKGRALDGVTHDGYPAP